MSEKPQHPISRRRFLAGSGVAAATAIAGYQAASAAEPDPAIINLPDHSRYLGDGVEARPYGTPSTFEAHVVRRDVEWLTASRQSSVNFTPLHELDGIITPNGLCFERHHAGIAEIDPAQHRLMINGLVEKPLVFTMDDIKRFPRENRVYFLECAANSEDQRQVDHGRRRRWLRHEPIDPARESHAGLHGRLPHEWRGAAPGAGLSAAARGAGLGRQYVDQMAAPHP